jgi:hypothetical protein
MATSKDGRSVASECSLQGSSSGVGREEQCKIKSTARRDTVSNTKFDADGWIFDSNVDRRSSEVVWGGREMIK